MGDLDVNGNVDYTAMPSYRGKSNRLDIKREIDQTESNTYSVTLGNTTSAWFEHRGAQTIKDLTNVSTSVEGVNIRVCPIGITNPSFGGVSPVLLYDYAVGITDGGTAGITQGDNVYDLFIINDQDMGQLEPQVFIPVTDLSKIVLVALPNSLSSGIQGRIEYASRLEINIR